LKREPVMAVAPKEMEGRMEAFMDACRRSGMKATHQRIEIFREIARTEEHPDAETIYRRVRQRIPTISLDTIYRTLYRLEAEGLISRVEVLSDRARFDANTDRHHHFVCTRCGLVRDFYSRDLDDYRAPSEVRKWGDISTTHMELRGVCATCLAKEGE